MSGLKKLIFQITEQNMGNIDKIVKALKTKKEESGMKVRIACVTKPAKVLTWTRNLSLESYIKQIETWNEVNEDVPTNMKYQDSVESLKVNKEIIVLPCFVAEYMLLC